MNLFHDLLTREQEQTLLRRIHSGIENNMPDREAESDLLSHNEKLIYDIAHKFVTGASPDVEIEDLMQEGRRGLLRAAQKWSPKIAGERGVTKFSTYATYWIYQYVRRYSSRHRSGFSRSVELDDASISLQKTRSYLLEQLQREPTARELARASGLPVAKVRKIMDVPEIVRLDEWDTGHTNHEITSDPQENPAVIAERQVMAANFIRNLDCLSPRHAKVIRMLYGLTDDRRTYSMPEIARAIHLTRARIRQLRNEALELMRNPPAF